MAARYLPIGAGYLEIGAGYPEIGAGYLEIPAGYLLMAAGYLGISGGYRLIDGGRRLAYTRCLTQEGTMPTKKTKSTVKSTKKTAKKVTPVAKTTAAAAAKTPTTTSVAAMFGVTVKPALTPAQIHSLIKALPGYVGLLDDAATQLDEDASLLGLKGLTGASLLALQGQQKFLASRESVAEIVYRTIYEQRLQVDSAAVSALFTINKRVEAMKSEDPDLAARWSFLSDFLHKFRPGSNAAKAATAANRADEKAVKSALKAKKGKTAPPPAAAN